MVQLLTLIDDDSLYAQVVLERLRLSGLHMEIRRLNDWRPRGSHPSCAVPDLVTWMAVDLSQDPECIPIVPDPTYRIWNANYYRSLDREFGSPYFVLIEIEARSEAKQWILRNGLKVHWHLEELVPTWNREVLTHPLMLEWLGADSCPEPHNDRVERLVFQDLLSRHGVVPREAYDQKQLAEELKSLANKYLGSSERIRRKYYPAHSYYRQRLEIELSINLFERGLYGDLY